MSPTREEDDDKSWTAHRKQVMATLDSMDVDIRDLRDDSGRKHGDLLDRMQKHKDDLQKQINHLEVRFTEEITALKTKASGWGAVYGAVTGGVISLVIAILARALFR